MPNNILVITRIAHELVRHIVSVGVCDVFDHRMDSTRGIVRLLVIVSEPMASIKHEPGLIDALQTQGITAASFASKDSADGNRLQAQG